MVQWKRGETIEEWIDENVLFYLRMVFTCKDWAMHEELNENIFLYWHQCFELNNKLKNNRGTLWVKIKKNNYEKTLAITINKENYEAKKGKRRFWNIKFSFIRGKYIWNTTEQNLERKISTLADSEMHGFLTFNFRSFNR